MASGDSLRYEVENLPDDQYGNKVTTIRYHGRLVSETADEFKGVVRPLIPLGGRIVLDFSDVNFLDSSGLGALVGLKATAIRQVCANWNSSMLLPGYWSCCGSRA